MGGRRKLWIGGIREIWCADRKVGRKENLVPRRTEWKSVMEENGIL